MIKIDLHKLADQAVTIGGPIVLAALAHKLATGRFDVRTVVREQVEQALDGKR